MASSATQVFSKQYIMQSGDTIFDVASRYTMNWRELAAYNNVKNPNDVPPGTVLQVPPGYVYSTTPNWLRDEPLKSGWQNG